MCFHFAHHPTIDLIGRSGGLGRAGDLPQHAEEQRERFTTHSPDKPRFCLCVGVCVGVCEGGSGGREESFGIPCCKLTFTASGLCSSLPLLLTNGTAVNIDLSVLIPLSLALPEWKQWF